MPRLLVALFLILFKSSLIGKPLDVALEAKGAILINADSGKVLFSKNPYEKIGPASTTKVLTALAFIDNYQGELDKKITAVQEAIGAVSYAKKKASNFTLPPYILEFGGTHIGIKTGEVLSIDDLLHGLLIPSANDAANLLALEIDNDIGAFVDRMNAYAKSIGCKNSYFLNPHGLYHPDQVTCAYDMGLIARKFILNQKLKEIASKSFWKRPETNLQKPTYYAQNNSLLRKGKFFYSHATGIKTGYTKDSGFNLVASAENGQRNLILVLLGEPSSQVRFEEAKKVFELAFNEGQVNHKILTAGKQNFLTKIKKGARKLQGFLEEDLLVAYYSSERPEITAFIDWKDDLVAPILEGDLVGEVVVKLDGVEVKRVAAVAATDVPVSILYRIGKVWKKALEKPFKSLSLLAVILFLIIFIKIEFFPSKKR